MDDLPGTVDVAVIGGGIAGASAAAELARTARVAVLEAEERPGLHSTGRSAAVFARSYGPGQIRALTAASEPFFEAPEPGFAEADLLRPRGALYIARADQLDRIEALEAETSAEATLRRLTGAEARARAPLLREGYVAAALAEEGARDIEVDLLHRGFLRACRARGGSVTTRAAVRSLARTDGSWRIGTSRGSVHAAVVVNAAGAWADEIARHAGARTVGLVPRRRTAILVKVPEGYDLAAMPLVVDAEERFYAKPDAGRLLASPADATPSSPCDAQPEEMDVAICAGRIEAALDIAIRRVEHSWAGLRSFVGDGVPVVGFDPERPGFFWLAAQGGYGIQTAPAMGRLAAALVEGREVPSDLTDAGVAPVALSPARFAHSADAVQASG